MTLLHSLLQAPLARVLYRSPLHGKGAHRVLLMGAGPGAALVVREIELRPQLGYEIVGLIEEAGVSLPAALARYPRLGCLDELAAIVADQRPSLILVALSDRRGHQPSLALLGHQLRGVVVEEAVEAYERLSGKLAIETLQPGSQLFKDRFRSSPLQDGLARATSLSCGLIGLTLLSPLLLLLGVMIRLSSPGPVLFRQQRIGLGGNPFELIKFRTMHVAEETATEWMVDNQARITWLGEWLRRLRLDELPQFINLVRGEMNLVGPRPHPVTNFNLFNARIPFYSLRCLVRPGLTGWAQVRYRYANNLAEETEKMRYDLYYIKHRSAWLDLQIIPATLMAVLAGRGTTTTPDGGALGPALAPPLELPAPLPASTRGRLDWVPGAAVHKRRAAANQTGR